MKLNKVKIENSRNLRSCELNLGARCTVVASRNGAGKTTVQEAIQSALFGLQGRKKDRHVSKFDPDAMPTVHLELAFNDKTQFATLFRSLLNKGGKWQQNGKTTRAKGKALDLVRQHLGIPAIAADTLLCGDHTNFANLLEAFPDDMQSLLTANCVKGSGPEPRIILGRLEYDWKAAKRKGAKNPGVLSVLSNEIDVLESELEEATAATERAKQLQLAYKTQLVEWGQLEGELKTQRDRLKQLQDARNAMANVLRYEHEIEQAKKLQANWNSITERIEQASRLHSSSSEDLRGLETQFRVKKKSEIEVDLEKLASQIEECEAIEAEIAATNVLLDERRRPDMEELELLADHVAKLTNLQSKIEATGVHFKLESKAAQIVDVSSDGMQSRKVEVALGAPVEGVAGNVGVTLGGFTFSAFGKENVAALKLEVEAIRKQQDALLSRFGCSNSLEFNASADKRRKLEKKITDFQADLKVALAGCSLRALKREAIGIEKELTTLKVDRGQEENAAIEFLINSSSIEKKIAGKFVEVENAKQKLRELEHSKPTETQLNQLATRLVDANAGLLFAKEAFRRTQCQQEIDADKLKALDNELVIQKGLVDSSQQQANSAGVALVKTAKDLEHSGGFRRLDELRSDIADANSTLERELRRQEGRELLMQRLKIKMNELAEEVPVQLADCVAKHLSKLTSDSFSKIELNDNLTVRSVCEDSEHRVQWDSTELSTGERTLVALSMRIAIALSVADVSGSAFVMFDDAFTNLDPVYLSATESLLESIISDDRIQIVLFTCHEDWAERWKASKPVNVEFVSLSDSCDYYFAPALDNLVGKKLAATSS